MVTNPSPAETPAVAQSPIRKPAVYRLLIIALLAEIAYGVMNLSTMPVTCRRTSRISLPPSRMDAASPHPLSAWCW